MKLKPLKSFFLSILVGIIIGGIFLTYMFLIGMPKTQAANYYNLAKQQQGLGDKQKADEYFQKSIKAFLEPYIQKDYQDFQSTK